MSGCNRWPHFESKWSRHLPAGGAGAARYNLSPLSTLPQRRRGQGVGK